MVAPLPKLRVIKQLAATYFAQVASSDLAVERMAEGVSTFVYRITRERERFYLRILPEVGASFAPEAHAHAVLRARGVSAPEVLLYEDRHPEIGLSVMLTTEIPGEPLSCLAGERARTAILFAAGRELAIINSIPVAGFGWVVRDPTVATALHAELPTARAFLLGDLEDDLALLVRRGLAPADCAAIGRAIERFAPLLDTPQGWLAHGDFDSTHIYGREGRYTGIIDFGEMRGAERAYDLGHFALRAWEANRPSDLGALLAGYTAIAPVPDNAMRRIILAALLIGVHALARRLRKRAALVLSDDLLRGVRRALMLLHE